MPGSLSGVSPGGVVGLGGLWEKSGGGDAALRLTAQYIF